MISAATMSICCIVHCEERRGLATGEEIIAITAVALEKQSKNSPCFLLLLIFNRVGGLTLVQLQGTVKTKNRRERKTGEGEKRGKGERKENKESEEVKKKDTKKVQRKLKKENKGVVYL